MKTRDMWNKFVPWSRVYTVSWPELETIPRIAGTGWQSTHLHSDILTFLDSKGTAIAT